MADINSIPQGNTKSEYEIIEKTTLENQFERPNKESCEELLSWYVPSEEDNLGSQIQQDLTKTEKVAGWIDENILSWVRKPYELAKDNFSDLIRNQKHVLTSFYTPKLETAKEFLVETHDELVPQVHEIADEQSEIVSSYYQKNFPLLYKGFDAYHNYMSKFRSGASYFLGEWQTFTMLDDETYEKLPVEKLPSGITETYRRLAETHHLLDDENLQNYVNESFEAIRPYSLNRSLRDSYTVRIIDSDVPNSYCVGDNIFISKKMVEILSPDELKAVLAHELSHGDNHQNLMTLYLTLGSTILTFGSLLQDDLKYFVTGEEGDVLKAVRTKGMFGFMGESLKLFGPMAPYIEIEADKGAARTLLRAGIPVERFEEALIRIQKEAEIYGHQQALDTYLCLDADDEFFSYGTTQEEYALYHQNQIQRIKDASEEELIEMMSDSNRNTAAREYPVIKSRLEAVRKYAEYYSK